METLVLVFGGVSCVILAVLAFVMWRDPEAGLRLTTHRAEMLPRVMADRYTALAFMALAFTWIADLRVLAVFFAACAYMGLTDGWLYARNGQSHWKHTTTGVLAIVALLATVIAYVAPA